MFVTIVLVLSLQADAIVIPSTCVQTSQKGTYVFVVKPDLTAEFRPVVADRAQNDETVISTGLSGGERVVTDGQFQLNPGAQVTIKSANDEARSSRP